MSRFPEKVLAAIDPEDPEERVLPAAMAIARRHGAEVIALTVLPEPLHLRDGNSVVDVGFEQNAGSALEATLHIKCEAHGFDPTGAVIVQGKPHKAVARYANEHGVDLVCVGADEATEEGFFLGTTALGVLRRANADVYCCRVPLDGTDFRKAVVAVELNDHAEHLLHRAKRFMQPYPDAELHVLNVVHPIDRGTDALLGMLWPSKAIRELTEQRVKASKAYLHEFLDDLDVISTTTTVVEGVPSKAVKQHVKALGADLLIIGTGENAGFGWHVGSTTQNVLHGVAANVLAVRPIASEA